MNYTPEEIEVGNVRLLELAGLLDRADAQHAALGEPAYDQTEMSHPCGTPACALGHAARHPPFIALGLDNGYTSTGWVFAIKGVEDDELFSSDGCGDAKNAKAAADYIRGFVSRRRSAV